MQANSRTHSFQTQFHRRWGHLHDPHVRALTWLLHAPNLLDQHAPQWAGKIATLEGKLPENLPVWLSRLDSQPESLHRYLGTQRLVRLGRYAERLMAFYFEHQNMLVGHGIQVRTGNTTIGEFDFLLRIDEQFVHWEFATKFYLLETTGDGNEADYFVGPNLADTLGAKMRKIFERQLILSDHPSAKIHLPEPVASAQALVKGWLFYHDDLQDISTFDASSAHCRGFWCPLSEAGNLDADLFAVLPRLEWLAPARLVLSRGLNKQALHHFLAKHFLTDTMPVMVALMNQEGEILIEFDRGFVVPNDWQARAGHMTRPIPHEL